MNEFENNPQSKHSNDVVDSIKGFVGSFLFFVLIFAIGVVISVVGG
ncbi:YqzM family protein [Oceanobacillus halophilus]|uniref:YqzM family protein n=1 Tax=Oceanobacillus halophilus TaxID=930130 RepID=A0A495AEK6_9BACI|nr:YqzM family protein [Oceanobacillus halophilus]RKQ37844.1 YqzM family protein [Oceanobacillus halophilus]